MAAQQGVNGTNGLFVEEEHTVGTERIKWYNCDSHFRRVYPRQVVDMSILILIYGFKCLPLSFRIKDERKLREHQARQEMLLAKRDRDLKHGGHSLVLHHAGER